MLLSRAMRPCLRAAALAVTALCAGCFVAQPCAAPLTACSGTCYDLSSDRVHCGSCTTVCAAGMTCSQSACVASPDTACDVRSGGAFVTLRVCGQSLKLWTTADAFVTRAEALLADPASPGATIPVVDVRADPDCDAQWSWHPDPVTPAWYSAVPDPRCDVCPSVVEDLLASWINAQWCPGALASDVVVVAVDRR